MENLYVCFKETGDKIVNVDSVHEGRIIIKKYEHIDRLEGDFKENKYMICELDEEDLYIVSVVE